VKDGSVARPVASAPTEGRRGGFRGKGSEGGEGKKREREWLLLSSGREGEKKGEIVTGWEKEREERKRKKRKKRRKRKEEREIF
jgi:hypothetical protein